MKALWKVALGILVVAVIASLVRGSWHIISVAQNDFAPLYVAARTVGTDQLYEPEPYRNFLIERFGGTNEALRYSRPPFYAIALWPLGLLPYQQAHGIYIVLRLAAGVAFVLLWRMNTRAATALSLLLSLPLVAGFILGQDGVFLLLFLGVAWRLMEDERPFSAGLALSLCAIKFHLFLTLPVWLASRARRPILKGFALGAMVLVVASFAVQGWRWPEEYAEVLLAPSLSPKAETMPNLHGLFAGFALGAFLEALTTVAVLWGCWHANGIADWRYSFSVVLLGGVLTSYHSYLADCIILLPAVLVLRRLDTRPRLRTAGLLMLLPAPLITGHPAAYLVQLGFAALFFAMAFKPSIQNDSSARGRSSDWKSTFATVQRNSANAPPTEALH